MESERILSARQQIPDWISLYPDWNLLLNISSKNSFSVSLTPPLSLSLSLLVWLCRCAHASRRYAIFWIDGTRYLRPFHSICLLVRGNSKTFRRNWIIVCRRKLSKVCFQELAKVMQWALFAHFTSVGCADLFSFVGFFVRPFNFFEFLLPSASYLVF